MNAASASIKAAMVKRLLLNAWGSGGFWLPGGIVVEDVGVDPVVSVGVVPG